MRKLLLLTITAFFLFSFLISNGQNTIATNPSVTINQVGPDPTNTVPINFSVVFDQPVTGFTTGDVIITGTAGAIVAVVTGGPTNYNVSISGMASCGTVTANIPAGVCINALSEPNLASTSTDNTVTYLPILPNPNVTINQALSQQDPTSASPINFTVQFDQAVTGFTTGDVTLSGTAGATTAIVTGSGSTYNVAVSGTTANGTVIATIAAGVCQNNCSQPNNASTSTDNTVTVTCVPPIVNVTPLISCGGIAGLACNGPLTASGNADAYVWSPLTGLYTDCTMTVPYTGTNLSTVYAGPTVNTIFTVTGTKLATGCTNSASAQVYYTPPAPVVTPPSVNMCLGDAAVKLKVTTGGIPANPAVWTPAAGLFADPFAVIPYVPGTAVDSVWVRLTPAGVYPYQVTTSGVPPGTPLCTSPPRTVVVTVTQPYTINTQPVNQTVCVNGTAVFTAGVTGTGPVTFQWQVSTNGGLTFNNVNNASPYTGGSTLTLVINPVSAAMNGYLYRLAINGGSGSCGAISTAALLTVGQAVTINTQPVNQTLCDGGAAAFTVGVTGTGPFAYQWQVSTNGGAAYTNIVNAAPYSGVNTATLTVNPATVGMNGYLYKVAISSGCSVATSSASLLTVSALPIIVITANPLVIGPAQTTTIHSTVTPNPAATYTWYYNTVALPGATADTLLVNYGAAGDYQLKVTDVNGCTNLSNIISIANSFSFNLLTYPNPSAGRFQVRYNSPANSPVQRSLLVYNNHGERVITKNFTQTISYQKIDVDVRANGKGFYWVELRDAYGRRLALSRVVVQ